MELNESLLIIKQYNNLIIGKTKLDEELELVTKEDLYELYCLKEAKKNEFLSKLEEREQKYITWLGEYRLDKSMDESFEEDPALYESVEKRLTMLREVIVEAKEIL
jgi:hypothetical protein